MYSIDIGMVAWIEKKDLVVNWYHDIH